MRTIRVETSKPYSVIIGSQLISQLGKYVSEIYRCTTVAIISDSNVWPLYGELARQSLQQAGYQTVHYCFPAGEESKNANTFFSILNFLAENKLTRSDLIIALGGGVVGDISGFAAATYLRGIPYVQVPTSLLAMVDSSVGGKTAIDLPSGKNLAGAFYQPSLVLCDIDALQTLPAPIFIDGCAEVIKYGVLYDAHLFAHLLNHGTNFDREMVISRCVELKRNVVVTDEFDNGARQKLNLGHTIGHGVEAQSNYVISHGQAVAIGMCIVGKAAAAKGICTESVYRQIHEIIKLFSLPTKTCYSAEHLYTSALSDKKRSGRIVNLILPREIGDCIISPTPVSEMLSFIEAGLS